MDGRSTTPSQASQELSQASFGFIGRHIAHCRFIMWAFISDAVFGGEQRTQKEIGTVILLFQHDPEFCTPSTAVMRSYKGSSIDKRHDGSLAPGVLQNSRRHSRRPDKPGP